MLGMWDSKLYKVLIEFEKLYTWEVDTLLSIYCFRLASTIFSVYF